ncbi:hypothetical protein [Selenomonas sputigena]|uniref:hypothetical protein n=1 Tax=Selenomonas sputigena TaxID=69823 RepID=UPI0028E638A9|nr:hypothetical protein [Selenomonas sputigena]
MGNGSYAKTSQEREPTAKRDWTTLTAAEPSKSRRRLGNGSYANHQGLDARKPACL